MKINISRFNEKALALGIRSSKMGAGNTEEDLSKISNEPTAYQERLKLFYEKEAANVRQEFTFHAWLRMQSSFYNSKTRGLEPKPSFEEWLEECIGSLIR